MSFHIDSKLKGLGDVLKSYSWEIDIPKAAEMAGLDADGFKIRMRSTSMPGRSIQPIESYFMGMKQVFAGRVNFNHTWPTVLEEFSDQNVMKALYTWHQRIFDVDPSNASGGGSKVMVKRGTEGYAVDIFLTLLNSKNEALGKKIKLVNAWPQNIDDVGLDYTGNDSVKINVTWAYDYWVEV